MTIISIYTTDLCNGDPQTMITLFQRSSPSHKTDWTSLQQLPALLRLLNGKVNSLIKGQEGEY